MSLPKGTSTDSSSVDEKTLSDVEIQGNPEDQEAAADSSSEADGKETVSEENWDPLSVVKKAVGKDSEEKPEGSDVDQDKRSDKSSQSENDGQKAENTDAPLGEITDEELKSYKPKTRKRIEGLLDDRSRLTERLAAMEPAAEQMENLQTFMREKNLTPQNVSELMVVGSLAMSADPKDLRAAKVRTEQFLAKINTALGEGDLPADLQKKVDDGVIDTEAAKEVARARASENLAQAHVQRTTETVKKRDTQQSEQQAASVVHQAISDWQRQKFSTDPDLSNPKKAQLLQEKIQLRVALAGGRVLDKAQALKIADEAYAEVSAFWSSLVPAKTPPAKRVVQSKGAPGNMASKPNSALDAAKAGLAKTKG